MSRKKGSKFSSKKRALKATVLTAGLFTHMMAAVPPSDGHEEIQPTFSGDSLAYLTKYLGIQQASAAEPGGDGRDDDPESEGGDGGDDNSDDNNGEGGDGGDDGSDDNDGEGGDGGSGDDGDDDDDTGSEGGDNDSDDNGDGEGGEGGDDDSEGGNNDSEGGDNSNGSGSNGNSSSSTPTDAAKPDAPRLLDSSVKSDGKSAPNSASLAVTDDGDGIRVAAFTLLSDGLEASLQQAKVRDTIFVEVSDLKDANVVTATVDGSAISRLATKDTFLAVRTGDVAIEIPAVSLPIRQDGSASAQVEMIIRKLTQDASDQIQSWATSQGLKLVGTPYSFSVTLTDNGEIRTIAGYGNRFARHTIPLPADQDPSRLSALLLRDGQYVPVPMTIDAQGRAVIHTTENATILIVERAPSDVRNDRPWADSALSSLFDKGLIAGTPKAEQSITRADFAALLVDALGLGQRNPASQSAFEDLPTNAESAKVIKIAVESGLFNGMSANLFAPDAGITREQMISVVIRAVNTFSLQLGLDGAPAVFSDEHLASNWARQELAAAREYGIVSGYSDGTVSATQQATLAEAAHLIRSFLIKAGLADR
jgi:Cobalamin biosynthesis protein CobT (nicotinate-mononucleotide:5, 6-dimethylbenzimidazole phosphoribosyltransferase)